MIEVVENDGMGVISVCIPKLPVFAALSASSEYDQYTCVVSWLPWHHSDRVKTIFPKKEIKQNLYVTLCRMKRSRGLPSKPKVETGITL